MLGASILWPMGYGYDEPQHVDMAYVYADSPFTFYDPGELRPTEAGRAILRDIIAVGWPPERPLARAPIADRGERPSLAELGGNGQAEGNPPNQMIQHPPLGYWVYAVALDIPGVDALAWDLQVWVLRLVSICLMLPVPILCWATARRLLRAERLPPRARDQLALVAALIPLTMPNLVRVGASVSNDVLLISSTSALLYLTIRVMTGDVRLKVAAGIAASLLVALMSKAPALFLPLLILAAYFLAARAVGLRRVVAPLAVAGIGGVLGAWWWVRNLVVHGSIQPIGYGDDFVQRLFGVKGDADDGRFRDFVGAYLSKFVERIWGGIGLADALTPGPVLVFGWFAIAAVGVVAALGIRSSRDARLRAWVLIGMVIVTVGVVAVGSFDTWQRRGVGPSAAQGRYIYHLVAGLSAIVVVGWGRALRPRVSRKLPALVLIGALVTNALSWLVLVRNWYGVDAGFASGARGLLRWAPTAPGVTLTAVVVLPVLLAVFTLVVLVRSSRGPTRRAVPDAGRPNQVGRPVS